LLHTLSLAVAKGSWVLLYDSLIRVFVFWPEWERAAVMQQIRKQTAALQRSKARWVQCRKLMFSGDLGIASLIN
jgi:hypothetical protein